MTTKSALAKALRAIATMLEDVDEQELERLIAGKGKLTFAATEKPKNAAKIKGAGNHEEILQQLNECKDRESAREVLATITNKNALGSLARIQKIHVAKHDRREDIENKIIEFVIGGKLRTEAIQTLNLKGSGDLQNG